MIHTFVLHAVIFKECQSFVTSVVLASDLVSRMSLLSLNKLRNGEWNFIRGLEVVVVVVLVFSSGSSSDSSNINSSSGDSSSVSSSGSIISIGGGSC